MAGELAVVDYVFNQGADGFVWDAEAEWESSRIGSQGPALAWQQCSTVRSNYPNKFLAHAPFPIIYLHSSFPYKEFGFWCDAIMPQIYHFSATKGSQSAAINWSDINWRTWQSSLAGLPPTNIGGMTVYWTNAIKPLAPINDVYGPFGRSPCEGTTSAYPDKHVMEFMDYLIADPMPQTAGGYKGVSFWRTDLHGTNQWTNIRFGTSGNFTGIVNTVVMDDPSATKVGSWNSVTTWANTTTIARYVGNGSGTDTNSFGTNYLSKTQGNGSAYIQFTPAIITPGNYDVYEWHPSLTNASAAVPVLITYSGGSTTVYANQQTNGGNWSLLGRFPFTSGTGATIRVMDNFLESGSVAVADGVKLAFAGALALPPPAAPSGLTATAVSTSRVDVIWLDNSTNETGFIVARGTNSAGPYLDLAPLPANITNYSDTGLSPNTTYYYMVRAFNDSGSSSNSVDVFATTFATPLVTIAAVGDNSFGQLNIPAGAVDAIALAAGDWHSLALRTNGTVLAWGNNYSDQCSVPASLSNAVAIAAGGYHSLAITKDGKVRAWGANDYGQCSVPGHVTDALAIAAGTWHSLALLDKGYVVAWGDNASGQSDVPSGLSEVIAISARGNHSLALRADGLVVAWGDNTDSEGFFSGQSVVPNDLTNAVLICAGDYHSAALRSNGALVCWGDNSLGQCAAPPGLFFPAMLAGGGQHTLALMTNGAVAAWGSDYDGQCDLPSSLSGAIAVAAGAHHSLVLLDNGAFTPQLFGMVRNGSEFTVRLQTLARKNYALEFKDSLSSSAWTSLATNRGNSSLLQFTDLTPLLARRFYRIRQW